MLQSASGVRVSGKNLDIGDSLRGQAEERVHEAVSKYFDGGFRSRVTVEKEGTGFRADCTVHLDSGSTMHVSASAHDAYSSISQVVERIAKQLRRDKRKRTAYANGVSDIGGLSLEMDSDGDPGQDSDDNADAGTASRPIIAERVDRLEQVSLEAAISRMENLKLSSYVFRNGGTNRINILHERADGSIGWIDVGESKT